MDKIFVHIDRYLKKKNCRSKLTRGKSAHVLIGSITSNLRVGEDVSHDENHNKDSRRMEMLVYGFVY